MSYVQADNEPNEFEAIVPADKMPPCPICGKPIFVPPSYSERAMMLFHAHGMAALAHESCRPKQ